MSTSRLATWGRMMALDRIITLKITAPGSRNQHGEYVPGPITFEGPVWAERRYLTLEDIADEGGMSNDHRREWKIRYREDALAAANDFLDRVSVTDGGIAFNLLSLIESPDERRLTHLTLEGVQPT